eukprot:Selendium_serpulae@DN5855_c0_g1_i1.p2
MLGSPSSAATSASTPAKTEKMSPTTHPSKTEGKGQKTMTPETTPSKKRKADVYSDEEEDEEDIISPSARKNLKKMGEYPGYSVQPPYSGSDPDVSLTQREKGQFMIEMARWGLVAGFRTSHHEKLLSAMINVIEDDE